MNDMSVHKTENTAETPERIEQGAYFTPLVDIFEKDDAFIFKADLPGVRVRTLTSVTRTASSPCRPR